MNCVVLLAVEAKDLESAARTIVEAKSWLDCGTYSAKFHVLF